MKQLTTLAATLKAMFPTLAAGPGGKPWAEILFSGDSYPNAASNIAGPGDPFPNHCRRGLEGAFSFGV